MTEIETYMKHKFDPKRFVVRERFKFWSEMQRKPGESVLELAARIRQAATACNFTAIKDPLDEALRTRFICSINNEAVLKALFKEDDELTFSRAVEIAVETEDAAKVAKETVCGSKPTQSVHKVSANKFSKKTASNSISSPEIDRHLQSACLKLCDDYADLFKPELGCLRDVKLEIEFKSESRPIFMKSRPVPFAMQNDLAQAYDTGISRGVWTPTQFNDWVTPVVPIRKPSLPGDDKPRLRVCGDYSVTVRKLGGGYGFTKIDLADAYNQVRLCPESPKRLALGTLRGVPLQNVLPFGISSAPGCFQKIMDDLTSDLPGVAVYLDDILVSGKDPKNHYHNLQRLLDRLHTKGLRCKSHVEYLGHMLKKDGIHKGHKVDAVLNMPAPSDVTSLKSFLGSVQFYAKFLLPSYATEAEPLY